MNNIKPEKVLARLQAYSRIASPILARDKYYSASIIFISNNHPTLLIY
jgi:hypothetical protein